MKIQTIDLEVERSGLQAESQFTIKATSKAFDILSSSLYSDKVLAVVRELSCNAYDSHVAAGKADTPIEIRLPTTLDLTFYVRDFGLGLSDFDIRGSWKHVDGNQISLDEGAEAELIHGVDGWERVGGIYTTFFESNKTHSDDFIGQLGLGSKSPFSYASTFIVESIFGGVKRIYTCFKNEENKPAIAFMGAQPTDECNGVMVSMSCRQPDIAKFYSAARKALMYFRPCPTVLGYDNFVPFRIKHTVEGTKWRIRDTESYANMVGAHVVQGFVSYPIDSYLLGEAGLSGTALALASTDIDMYVDIGKVEVAASREALSYVPHTVKNLVSAFERAAAEIRGVFQREFDKCTTVWEVAMTLARLENSGMEQSAKFAKIFQNMNTSAPFQWKGADVTSTIKLNLEKIQNTQLQRVTTSRARRITRLNVQGTWHPTTDLAKVFEMNVTGNTLVVVDTEHRGGNNQLKELLVQRTTSTSRAGALFIRPTSRLTYDQGEINALLEMLGNPPVIKMSDLMPAASTRGGRRSTSTKRAPEQKLVFTRFPDDPHSRNDEPRRKFSRLTWETQEVDLSEGGFYVELYRFEPVDVNGVEILHLDDIISLAKKLDLLPTHERIIGLSEKEVKKAHKASGEWRNLFDYLRTEFAEANAEGEMYSGVVADSVFGLINGGAGLRKQLAAQWDTYGPRINDGQFKSMMQVLVDLHEDAGTYQTADVVALTGHLSILRGADTRQNDIPEAWSKMLKGYEMLKLVTTTELSSSWIDPVIRYVNMIDA